MSGITVWLNEKDAIFKEERSPPVWSEERCEELWDRVEGVRHKITRVLNPAKLTPYLRQCKVIDEQDEDEVLNSTQYPLRVSKAGRLLDILRAQGPRGLQAFMESLEFYHPQQYTQLTGEQPTQRCSLILDEEGPEGLTQFLLLEVRKLREQLRNSHLSERRLSQQCRAAEEERSRAVRKAQELLCEKQQLQRLRQDWESASQELGKLKDRHLEQAVKYSKALEEQGKASTRERELLRQVEELKSRLLAAENSVGSLENTTQAKANVHSRAVNGSPAAPPQKVQLQAVSGDTESQRKKTAPATGVSALMDILQQDRREASEQREELCDIIARLQGELQSAEEQRDELLSQCEQLQLKLKGLHLDWETEQKRSLSYFNQIIELEKERDQALRSRDGLQLEYTDCLLDKNRLRKCIAELEADLDQQQKTLERERVKNQEQREQNNHCLSCSHLSLCSEDQCYGPCCSLGLELSPRGSSQQLMRKAPSRGQTRESSEDSNSEENLLILSAEDNEKEINRLSTFPFPPCMNSINRRFNTEFRFDLDSWGSDDNDNVTEVQTQPCLWDSWNSLHSQPFTPDLVNTLELSSQLSSQSPSSPSSLPRQRNTSLADDITIVGGNLTGIFVSHVRPGSQAEQCGLKEGSELLELEQVLSSGGSVLLGQCTAEVAHFSLQWWTEPQSLKHRTNPESYSQLCSQILSPTFMGADSFYVRVNLNMEPHGDSPSLSVSCDDIIHVTDTRYNGKYNWRCTVVDPNTTKPLQTGTMPNYNRAQQMLLVKLRKMALEENHFTKKVFHRKSPDRVRLVKAVDPHNRGSGSSQVFYTLSKRHEEHLIPYSLVQPVQVQTKRPVIFTPSLLSHGLIQRLLHLTGSDLSFDTCAPEPVPASERQDKNWFLLSSCSSEKNLGIRLKSIQNVIEQDKHCLLELGLSSVEGLIRQGIYPIVIHVRRKNKKHKKLRKFFPNCGENNVVEEVCQAEELQLETLPLLFHTLEPSSWGCTDELLAAICNVIHSQQRAVAWIELDRLQ